MNTYKQFSYSSFFFVSAIAHIGLTAMDLPRPQLQLENASQKIILHGNLFIDPIKDPTSYPHHVYNKNHPVEYLTQQHRQMYNQPITFKKIPLRIPFIHVFIRPMGAGVKFSAVIPTTKLLHCSDGSIIDLTNDTHIFRLTCTKNEKLKIDPQHFPKGKEGNTFETQFLSCMNQFYAELPYRDDNLNLPELIEHKIVHCEAIQRTLHNVTISNLMTGQVIYFPTLNVTRYQYKHGKNGCSKTQDLIELAATRTIKPYGSPFNFVMNRQHSAPHSHQSMRMAQNQINKYHHERLEQNSKDKATDMSNTIAPDEAMLDSILEDCWIEFTAQK